MSFMVEEFKKTFQENHQPLIKNIKKQIRNSSRESVSENSSRIHHDASQSLSSIQQGKGHQNKQNQQKFFVYVNSQNSPNSHHQKEDSIRQQADCFQNKDSLNQRRSTNRSSNQFNDENNFGLQSTNQQLEDTLSLNTSDLNTLQINNMALNSFRGSLNTQNLFQPVKKTNQNQQQVAPLQNNTNYINIDQSQQSKSNNSSYQNSYNLKEHNINAQPSNKAFNNMPQNKSDRTQLMNTEKNLNFNKNKQFEIYEDNFSQASIPSLSQRQNNSNRMRSQQSEHEKGNNKTNNQDKMKTLQNNNKYTQGINSIQSQAERIFLQSNQNFSITSMPENGSFSISSNQLGGGINSISYGLSQYYLLNMHHIVRIQKFFKSRYQKQKQENYQYMDENEDEEYSQDQREFYHQEKINCNVQQNIINNKYIQDVQNKIKNIAQNNLINNNFLNSMQQPLDINISNINNVSNSFNIDAVSFGQRDNLFQMPSERSNRGDQHLQHLSFQNQTFEDVEEVEDEEEENVQTPIHQYPTDIGWNQSSYFDQQGQSLQKQQSVDIDNIQGRFDQEEEVNIIFNPQQQMVNPQKQNNLPKQQNNFKVPSLKDHMNALTQMNQAQFSPKFPTNIESHNINGQQNQLKNQENKQAIQEESHKINEQTNNTSSNQSNSSGSSQYSLEQLKQENTKLKKMVYQMKLDMKSQLEEGLVQQRNQMKTINDEYLQFIEKIMTDKKELTKKCDSLMHENQQLNTQIQKMKSEQDAHCENKQEEQAINDSLKEKMRKVQSENDKLFDQIHKQQEYIIKLQNENEDMNQKVQNIQNEIEQKKIKSQKEREENIEYLQNQIENLNSQLQDERLLNEELQNQLANQKQTSGSQKNLTESMNQKNTQQQLNKSDIEEQLECFKQQFIEEISEKVEELQNQLEKERENVSRLLHSSKLDGNEIVQQLRNENAQLKQQIQSNYNNKHQNEQKMNKSDFDSVKINELETLISSMEEERKQACDMVKLMKDAHDKMKEKYEEDIKQLKEKHSLEFCKYEENIRYTIEKKVKLLNKMKRIKNINLKQKDQSIQKLYLVIENLKNSILANYSGDNK